MTKTDEPVVLFWFGSDHQTGLMPEKSGVPFRTFKDQVIVERNEEVKADVISYTVFTPYSRVWKKKLTQNDLTLSLSEKPAGNFQKTAPPKLPSPEEIGFAGSDLQFSAPEINTHWHSPSVVIAIKHLPAPFF